MGRLTAIVLGSAAGGAFPQWNCRCPVCQLAWAGDKRVAQVHDNGPASPPVGRLEGTGGQGELKGRLIDGHSVYEVEFKMK